MWLPTMSGSRGADKAATIDGPRPPSGWWVTGRSVVGASHVRAGTENQDAIRWAPGRGWDERVVLAVSDGHGSPANFRSAEGALLAVRTARRVGVALLAGAADNPASLSLVNRSLEEETPRYLVREWRRAVEQDLAVRPLLDEELAVLVERAGPGGRQRVEDDPVLAYGATLLVVLATEAYVAYLQLGDGAIVEVPAEGDARRALPDDPLAFANETTSLCSGDAWRHVRVRFDPQFGSPPPLVLLSSDGVVNSFADEAGFLGLGPDLLGQIRADGFAAVEDRLDTWLAEMTQAGSGDDVTLGFVVRGGG